MHRETAMVAGSRLRFFVRSIKGSPICSRWVETEIAMNDIASQDITAIHGTEAFRVRCHSTY